MRNLLPLLADFANGIFAVALAASVTGTPIAWWHFAVGVVCAMLPDVDAIPELVTRKKISASVVHEGDHRELLHYPLAWLAVGGLLAWTYGFFGFVFLIAVMLHFLNDLYGTGWGIAVFWPLSRRRYKLLGRRVNRMKSALVQSGDWSQLPQGERSLRPVVSWSREELGGYIRKYGIDEWVTPYYLRLNWISGLEYALFLLAAFIVLYTLLY